MDEQKGNKQKTVYFKITDLTTNNVEYYKNAHKYYTENNLNKYVEELIKYGRTYQNKKYERITKEEYNKNKKCND